MERPFSAYAGDGPYWFVSYAHADSEVIFAEMAWLRDADLNLWYDEGIAVGAEWRQALVDAIAGCEGLLFFATQRSVTSSNCIRELNFAIDENKPVCVVKLDDAELPDVLRLSLSDRQALVRAHFDESGYRQRLLDALADGGRVDADTPPRASARGRRWVPWVALVAVGLAVAVGFFVEPAPAVPVLSDATRVTNATGVEEYPSWSPGGEMVVYHSNEDGDWDIYRRRLSGGRSINLTSDHTGHDMFPSWSPDGTDIAFWSDRETPGYYRMDADTGEHLRLLRATETRGHSDLRYKPIGPPRWSADGTRLLYAMETPDAGSFAEVQSLASGEVEITVEMTGPVPGFDPIWWSDEQHIAYVSGWHREYETSAIRVMPLTPSGDAPSVAITNSRVHHLSPSWASERQVAYVANRRFSRDLWLQTLGADLQPIGEPDELTTGLDIRQASWSSDRSRLAYSQGRRVGNVWRVPILDDRAATWDDAQQITFDQAWVEFLDISPDGRELAISSDRDGNKDLWVLPAAGGEAQNLTQTPVPEWAVAWSPDGTQIAYYGYYQGKRNLFVVDREGGAPTRIEMTEIDQAFVPAWSPDGSRIAFRGIAAGDLQGNNDLYVVELASGAVERVTEHPAMDIFARWAPDGTLSFVSNRGNQSRVWVAGAPGQPPTVSSGAGMSFHDWAPDAQRLFALGVQERKDDIWELQPDGSERIVAQLKGGRRGHIGSEAFATDGKFLYFTWEDDLGDIWVMDVTWE